MITDTVNSSMIQYHTMINIYIKRPRSNCDICSRKYTIDIISINTLSLYKIKIRYNSNFYKKIISQFLG